jgi:hypothetical protein
VELLCQLEIGLFYFFLSGGVRYFELLIEVFIFEKNLGCSEMSHIIDTHFP